MCIINKCLTYITPMIILFFECIYGLDPGIKQLQNNMFRFNQQFRKYQRNGKNDFMLLSYLDKDLQKFRLQLNYSFQQVSQNYAKSINDLYNIINDNSELFGREVGKEKFCTNIEVDTNEDTIESYLYQILQAYQFMTNNSEDIFLLSGIKGVLENITNQIQTKIQVSPEVVQFTTLTKGNIYQLRQLNQNDDVDVFNNQQANGYNQNQPWFRDFFGTSNDDILLIVDCSNIYSEESRQGILFTVEQFLEQISPSVSLKIILMAENIMISSQSYINLKSNQKVISEFIQQIPRIDLGKHVSETFLQDILQHEIEDHNLYRNTSSYTKFQPFKLLNVYAFVGSIYSSDQYQIESSKFDVMVTFVKYQKNFISLKAGVNVNLQQRIKTLALFIQQSNARFILIHSRISDYLQAFHQRGISDYITIYCTAEVMPWYYSFCDNLNVQNQQNRELIILLSVQQIIENLQPDEGELMITRFRNLTLFSVPVYVNTSKGMHYLAGFLTVAMNLDKMFSERRELIQNGEVVAISHDIGQIINPSLIIQDENNTQFVVEDQYLHVVDTLQTDSKFQLRAVFVMDQVLNYSNEQFHITTLKEEDCVENFVNGYFACLVTQKQEFYFNKTIEFSFYILANDTIVSHGIFDNSTNEEAHKMKVKNFQDLINESDYNTQLRLITTFLGNDQYFANNLYTNKNYYEYQTHPHLICSIDKVICGFTNMKILNQQQINVIIERLLGMQQANKNTANYANYTNVMYIAELRKLYVVQRHYVSMNVMKLYANTTFLLRIVCISMPEIQQLFLSDCLTQSANIQQSVYFVDFDGNVQYQISCISNEIKINALKRNIERDGQLIDLYLIMLQNNLYNTTTKTVNFLTSYFKNNIIYSVNMLDQLNGSGVYQQFEGSLLMMAIQIDQYDIFEYKVLLQQAHDRNTSMTQTTNQTTIISGFDPIYNFKQYRKRMPFKNDFDSKAKVFYQNNQQYFEDQQQDVNVFEFPTVHVIVSIISVLCMLLLYFI